MPRNGMMRRANLRRIATRIERVADRLERRGIGVVDLRRHIASLRREADVNAPRWVSRASLAQRRRWADLKRWE